MKSLKLATFPRRQYDPKDTSKDFTTMVKVKPFTHEEDAFSDLFIQNEMFSKVMHLASLLFSPDDLEAFHDYKERILLQVPFDPLQVEPIREPTPTVSLDESSRENSKENSEAKSQ